MFFFRKRQHSAPHGSRAGETGTVPERPQFFEIDFDMMLKGSIHQRRSGTIRQYGVTVNGATRLVTSGDTVDFETYRALLAAGAIRPHPAVPVVEGPNPPILDDTSSGRHDV